MKRPTIWRGLLLCLLAMTAAALCINSFQLGSLPRVEAQEGVLKPPEGIEAQGVPPVPAMLADQMKRYTGAYGLPLAGWHPDKRELWVKGISTAAWVSRIEAPEGPQKTWIYLQMGGVYDFYFSPQAKHLIYNRDSDGDESFQMYLYNIDKRQSARLSEGKSRNTEFVWSNKGDRVVHGFSPAKGEGVSLALADPFDSNNKRLLVESTGNYLKAYDWSPDDKQIAYCEFISNTNSKRSVTKPAALEQTRPDGRYLYGSADFSQQLIHYDRQISVYLFHHCRLLLLPGV